MLIKQYIGGMYRQWCTTRGFKKYVGSLEGQDCVRKLERLKGAYSKRRCFIIGNGPSLNKTDLSLLKGEVTIGCNGLFLAFDRMPERPTLYTVEDVLVAEDRAIELKDITGSIKIAPLDVRSHLKEGGFTFANFHRRYFGFPKFGHDLARMTFWGGTVTYFNIQIAKYLGCSQIILIGIDHNYGETFKIRKDGAVWTSEEDDKNHFDPRYFGKGYRWHDPAVEIMEAGYRKAQIESKKYGVEILNATIETKLKVFKQVEYKSLFK